MYHCVVVVVPSLVRTLFVVVRFVLGIFLSLIGILLDILPASTNRFEIQSVRDVGS
jgi:hypothetical protein